MSNVSLNYCHTFESTIFQILYSPSYEKLIHHRVIIKHRNDKEIIYGREPHVSDCFSV